MYNNAGPSRRTDYTLPQIPASDSNGNLMTDTSFNARQSSTTRAVSPASVGNMNGSMTPPLPPKEAFADRRSPSGLPSNPRPQQGHATSPVRPSRPSNNPLTDLIETETAYVDALAGIIKRVAGAWSRTNFPPRALDRMFRAIEKCYRVNKSLLGRLNEIGPSPASPKALGDLLMRWIDDIEEAYRNYATSFRCSFDVFEPVQMNPNLPSALITMPARLQSLDDLFFLPHARLKYYKKLYTKLLRSTEEGRSDHRLLSSANLKLDELLASCAATQDLPAVADEDTPITGTTEIAAAEQLSPHRSEEDRSISFPSSATSTHSQDKGLPPEPPRTPTGSSNGLTALDQRPPVRQPRGSSYGAVSPIKASFATPPRSPAYKVELNDKARQASAHASMDSQATVTSSSNASNSLRGSGEENASNPSSRATSWDSRRPESRNQQRSSSQLSQRLSQPNSNSFCDTSGVSAESAQTIRSPNKRLSSMASGIQMANIEQLESELDTSKTLDVFTMKPKKCRLQINPPTLPFSRQILHHADVSLSFRLSVSSVQQRQSTLSNASEADLPTELHVQMAHIFLLTDLFLICECNVDANGQFKIYLLFPPLAGKHLRVQPVEEDPNGQELDIIIMKREVLSIRCPSRADRDRWLYSFEQCIAHGSQVNLKVSTELNTLDQRYSASSNQSNLQQSQHALQNGAIYSPIANGPPSPLPALSPSPSLDVNDNRQQFYGSVSRLPPPHANNQDQLHPSYPRAVDQQRSFSGPAGGAGYHAHDHQSQAPRLDARYRENQPVSHSQAYPPDAGRSFDPSMYTANTQQNLSRRPTASSLPPGAALPALNQSAPYSQNSNFTGSQNAPYSHHQGLPLRPQDRNSAPFRSVGPSQGFESPPPMRKEASRSMGSLRDYAQQQQQAVPPLPGPSRKYASSSRPVSGNVDSDDEDSPPNTPRERAAPTTNQIVAQMKCKVFLQTSHQQWKSLGTSKLSLYLQSPGNIKQLVVQNDNSSKTTLISTIILTDGVERVGKTGVAIELSDQGARTGIVYMLQLKTEQSAVGLYKELLAGSSRRSAAA